MFATGAPGAASQQGLANYPCHANAPCRQDCGRFFPPGMFDDGRPGRGRGATWPPGWPALSGKFAVLAAMLERLRPTGDRIVIVSNYTQTLDLFAQLCRERGVRLHEGSGGFQREICT